MIVQPNFLSKDGYGVPIMIKPSSPKIRFAGMLLLVATSLAGAKASSQSPSQPDITHAPEWAFQVATIKPSKPDELMTIQFRGRRFATTATSLVDLLKYCYGVHASQIVDAPDWIRTTRFDILADPNTEGRPSSDEMKKMVQGLLADRFHLVLRRAKKVIPVYAIVVAKHGPKLIKSTKDPNGIPAAAYRPGGLIVANATLSDLGTFLQRYVTDRPVVNRTEITGKYDLQLRWTPDDSRSGGMAQMTKDDTNALPDLYTAIQEQLGLKLKATKALTDVLVIGNVEMPSQN